MRKRPKYGGGEEWVAGACLATVVVKSVVDCHGGIIREKIMQHRLRSAALLRAKLDSGVAGGHEPVANRKQRSLGSHIEAAMR